MAELLTAPVATLPQGWTVRQRPDGWIVVDQLGSASCELAPDAETRSEPLRMFRRLLDILAPASGQPCPARSTGPAGPAVRAEDAKGDAFPGHFKVIDLGLGESVLQYVEGGQDYRIDVRHAEAGAGTIADAAMQTRVLRALERATIGTGVRTGSSS